MGLGQQRTGGKSKPLSSGWVAGVESRDLAQLHPDKAIARLDKVIEQFPDNPRVRNLKGEVLANLKRTDAALVSFREAIARSPTWTVPYQSMAAAESAAGRNEDAIKSLQEGLKASNGASLLVVDLGGLYERLGRIDEAIDQYEGLLKRDPQLNIIWRATRRVPVSSRP